MGTIISVSTSFGRSTVSRSVSVLGIWKNSAAVTVRGPEAQIQTLTKDSLKVIVHLTGPITDSATVHVTVVAPRGITARAIPDSVLVIRRRGGRG